MATWVCEQDEEDFEQEKRIQAWLFSQPRAASDFTFQHFSRKGTARNTLVRANISLDQKLNPHEARSGTFADVIAGSDGRDLYSGPDFNPEQILDAYLACLGFTEELSEWVLRTLKKSNLQSSWLYEKSAIDLELLPPFNSFNT